MLTNSSPYGFGVVSTIDADIGDVLFTEQPLLFGQDSRSYAIQPRCMLCTLPRPCGRPDHDDSTQELERYLQTEVADADPRGRLALAIISSDSRPIRQFLHRDYRPYTKFAEHSQKLIKQLTNISNRPASEIDSILGMLRSVCLSVTATSTHSIAPLKMSDKELKRMWLSIGEV